MTALPQSDAQSAAHPTAPSGARPPRFDNSFARLDGRFFARQAPVPVALPRLIALNRDLAARLGLDPDWLESAAGLGMVSGNAPPPGAAPLAQAYAGHQFGGWVPQLGDGRAILLGEVLAPDGLRFDIQLKGAGRTVFSRGGDGRAWLGPVLREYVLSEAMAALGLPTTRALAAALTGETIQRDGAARPGAILTRVAASHLRVGTFQYFAAQGDVEALRILTDYAIDRHYPGADGALGLLRGVAAAQGRLIAGWMSLGFVHGVMNTDNMAISGETIDYGPCAFIDAYRPDAVFSSIDVGGRYAWANQAPAALWNLAQLGSALLPLIGSDEAAIDAATEAVNSFSAVYQAEWTRRFGRKIGLAEAQPDDLPLIQTLLTEMAAQGADFTRTFRGLATGAARAEFRDPAGFDAWASGWRARLARDAGDPAAVMRAANPARIPRNHRVEQMIAAALADDYEPFHALMAGLANPFDDAPGFAYLEQAPAPEETVWRTFCGT